MAIMAMDTAKKTKLATFCVATVFSQFVNAGDWQFNPSLLINETYSDNVELTFTDEVSSLVSQTGLALSTSYDSQYLTFDLNSTSVYATYTHDHDLDDDFHTLDSNLNLKLTDQGLSIVGSAKVENRAKNETLNSLADIVSADTVKTELYSGGLSYDVLNNDFLISSTLMYTLKEAEDGIGNQEGYNSSIVTKNGNGAKLFYWDIVGNYYELKNRNQSSRMYQGEIKIGLITDWKINPFVRYYDEDNKGSLRRELTSESVSYGAGVRWYASPRLQIDLSYNKPIGNALDTDGNEQKEYVDASIDWQPSIRTKVSANLSQRFFGDSYGLSISHQSKRLSNSISYQETVESFTRNNYNLVSLGSFFCPRGDSSNLNSCFAPDNTNISFDDFELVNLIDYELIEDNVYSLNKSLSWNTSLTLSRTTFSLNISSLNRENLETNIEDQRDLAGLAISRITSERSSINFNATYNDNRFKINTETERQDRYRNISMGYEKSLNSALHINFDLAHINRSSNAQELNYKEARLTFKITKDY